VPKQAKFEDENLLENIKLDAKHSVKVLDSIDRCILLGLYCSSQRKNRIIKLSVNNDFSYTQIVLFKPKIWSIQIKTLLLNSTTEINDQQKVTSALEQIEIILMHYEKLPRPSNCLDYIFSSNLEDRRTIQHNLGKIYFDLKFFQSALIVFEHLADLTKCCNCLMKLKRTNEIQKLVQKKLKENPTPFLYCLLGDVTLDNICYEIAWELSNHSYAKAQN